MQLKKLENDKYKILLIFFISIFIDSIIFINNNPPGWDQGYHLSNAFKMANIISTNNLNFLNKFNSILNVTDSYRGPLTYLLSSILISFKRSYTAAYLSNHIFSLITILSISKLSKEISPKPINILAILIFVFSPLIVSQRADYLIDISSSCFYTLNILFLTKWFLDKSRISIFSAISGISIGLTFLVKPTNIIFLILPILFLLIKKFKFKKERIFFFYENFLLFIFFILVIFPWFSRHWITIISSIINAWNWGVNYQSGLESLSFEGWIYYIKNLPIILGNINTVIIVLLIVVGILKKNRLLNIFENKNEIWYLTFFLNYYLIISLMSTKDIRFFIPIYPLLCIYIARLFYSFNVNKRLKETCKILIISSLSFSLITSNLINTNVTDNYIWPHEEIIKTIEKENPYLLSTLAVIPDTKEINTFNLEAEAARQGEKVAVRQVVSNTNTYQDDLKYFDWFLVKTNDQGIMTSESKVLLSNYLLNNESFLVFKEWQLPDKSIVKLLKRKVITLNVKKVSCQANLPVIEYKKHKKYISLNLIVKGALINQSNLLLEVYNKDYSSEIALSNGSFNKNLIKNECYRLNHLLPIDNKNFSDLKYKIKGRLQKISGEVINADYKNQNNRFEDKFIDFDNQIFMTNKIVKVFELGQMLKNGKFERLFNLVGILNQSDPSQNYLKNAETRYKLSYKENKNLDNLYAVLISQILQRKVDYANQTINQIIKYEDNNGNTFLSKGIISLYLLKPADARTFINLAKENPISHDSKQILRIADGLADLLNIKLINAYNKLV